LKVEIYKDFLLEGMFNGLTGLMKCIVSGKGLAVY